MTASVTILVAEDEPFVRTVLVTTLQREGIGVIACKDGAEALATISGNLSLDGMLLDFMMPRAHGLHVLKQIRCGRTGQPRNLPVAMLTSASDKQTVALSMALDCDAFLVKPVNRETLLNRVERLAGRRNRPIQEVSWYEALDVGPPGDLSAAKAPIAGFAGGSASAHSQRIPATQLRPGMRIVEDLLAIDGTNVVPAGAVVTDSLVAVLGDLEKIVPLRPVAIEPV
ncbi:MAG: hypothetical protein RLY86_2744 [Pseudomonadota bacterium]|jgi:CheY-like chemotaxis protein